MGTMKIKTAVGALTATKIRLRTALFILLTAAVFSGCRSIRQIENPYGSVNWAKCGQYKANLHTHTTVRGGWMNPQTVVGKYRDLGYHILAITDHGAVTYPWEKFSEFKADERTKQRIVDKVLKPQENEPIKPEEYEFKDVNPLDMDMVAVQGSEISYRRHDVNSYYNNYKGTNPEATFDSIASKGGLAVLNHPGRYKFPVGWYVDLYSRYKNLAGLEVFNCGNRYPNDRRLWDSILTVMSPVRPVWGFSNDDVHSARDMGRNWNVVILPRLNDKNVRHALENGITYFVNAPEGHKGELPPSIHSVKVGRGKSRVKIEASGYDSIVWVSGGQEICKGSQFSLKMLPGGSTYFRAELYGAGKSIVCTQPFTIKMRGKRITN